MTKENATDSNGYFSVKANLLNKKIYCLKAESTDINISMNSCFKISNNSVKKLKININPLTQLEYSLYKDDNNLTNAEEKVKNYFGLINNKKIYQMDFNKSIQNEFKNFANIIGEKIPLNTINFIKKDINIGQYKNYFHNIKLIVNKKSAEINNSIELRIEPTVDLKKYQVLWIVDSNVYKNKNEINITSDIAGNKNISVNIINTDDNKTIFQDNMTVNFYKKYSPISFIVARNDNNTTINLTKDVTLNIQKNSIPPSTKISMTKIVKKSNDTYEEFQFEPSGLTFQKPLKITLKYDPNVISDPRKIKVLRFSKDGTSDLVKIDDINYTNHTITFSTNHFTTFKIKEHFYSIFSENDMPKLRDIFKYAKYLAYTNLDEKTKQSIEDYLNNNDNQESIKKFFNTKVDTTHTYWDVLLAAENINNGISYINDYDANIKDILKSFTDIYLNPKLSVKYDRLSFPHKIELLQTYSKKSIEEFDAIDNLYKVQGITPPTSLDKIKKILRGFVINNTISFFEPLYKIATLPHAAFSGLNFASNIIRKKEFPSDIANFDKDFTKWMFFSEEEYTDNNLSLIHSNGKIDFCLKPSFDINGNPFNNGENYCISNGHLLFTDKTNFTNDPLSLYGGLIYYNYETDDTPRRTYAYIYIEKILGLRDEIKTLYKLDKGKTEAQKAKDILQFINAFYNYSKDYVDYTTNQQKNEHIKSLKSIDPFVQNIIGSLFYKLYIKKIKKDLLYINSLNTDKNVFITFKNNNETKSKPAFQTDENFTNVDINLPKKDFSLYKIKKVSIEIKQLPLLENTNANQLYNTNEKDMKIKTYEKSNIKNTLFKLKGDTYYASLKILFPNLVLEKNNYYNIKVNVLYSYDNKKDFLDEQTYDFALVDNSLKAEKLKYFSVSGETDDIDGNAISGVDLFIASAGNSLSDKNGKYKFDNLAPGVYTIRAYKDGYVPYNGTLTINDSNITYNNISMIPKNLIKINNINVLGDTNQADVNVSISNLSKLKNIDNYKLLISYGDGTKSEIKLKDCSKCKVVTKRYKKAGNYTITAEIIDEDLNVISTYKKNIYISTGNIEQVFGQYFIPEKLNKNFEFYDVNNNKVDAKDIDGIGKDPYLYNMVIDNQNNIFTIGKTNDLWINGVKCNPKMYQYAEVKCTTLQHYFADKFNKPASLFCFNL